MGSPIVTNDEVLRFHPLTGKTSKPNATEYAFLTQVPSAKYSRLSEFLRKATSGNHQCKLFCGGKKCKYENGESHWSQEDMAINGLYSSWITDKILAMARPNTINVLKYDMIGQFKRHGIRTIINLQKAGEHPACGQGLVDGVGFSYDPQLFMDNGIFHYNFGWDDYGVTSISTLLDMVRVFKFATQEGKVAVHCHAGLGRTGVLITCFLSYDWRISANRAIQQMRMNRPQAVQTRQQMSCVRSFAAFLRPLQVIFPHQHVRAYEFSLVQFLRRQRYLLHGYEARVLHYIPKIIYVIGERILVIAGCQRPSLLEVKPALSEMEQLIPRAFQGSRNQRRVRSGWEDEDEEEGEEDGDPNSASSRGFDCVVGLTKSGNNPTLHPNSFRDDKELPKVDSKCASATSLQTQSRHEKDQKLSSDNLATPEPLQSDDRSVSRGTFREKEKGLPGKGFLNANSQSRARNSASDVERECAASSLDEKVPNGKVLGMHTGPGGLAAVPKTRDDVSCQRLDASRPLSLNSSTSPTLRLSPSAAFWQDVAETLLQIGCQMRGYGTVMSPPDFDQDRTMEKTLDKINRCAQNLNNSDDAWSELEKEKDVHILSGLFWSWIDQLKEPILSRQDLNKIVNASSKPVEIILKKMDKGTRETLKYLVGFMAHLETGNDDPIIVQSGIDLMPKERLGLLLHLTEQLCHQDFIQAIKSFIDEAKLVTTLENNDLLLGQSLSQDAVVSTLAVSSPQPRPPSAKVVTDCEKKNKRLCAIPTLDHSDAIVIFMFIYRLFVYVSRKQDLITDFDHDGAQESVIHQLFLFVSEI